MRSLLLAIVLLLATAATATAATGPCMPGGPTCHFWAGKVTFIADGDTIDVRIGGHVKRVRITGLNAMEMTRYSKYPARRRGACHAVAATARIEQLLRAGHLRV